MSASPQHVGRVPSRGANAKDATNAGSGDPAYKTPRVSPVGRVPPRGASPEGAKEGGMVALAELSESRVAQDGPQSRGEFTYVDISSIDRETKRIVDPKVLPVTKAPSRARQVLKSGDVVVSMTR